MLKLFFACICIGYTVSINAQESINGRILDEHEQGFEAAVVMLVSLPENILIETAVTDSTGRFHLPVHKGEFLLCIRSLGYKEKTKNITISGPNTIPDIYLEPDEIFLQDVVVTARKSRPITSFSNGKVHINVAQSYLTDIGSALDVLKHSPGVSVNNKGDISLASLGGTAIYVNGSATSVYGCKIIPSALNIDKNCLISLVKSDNFENFVGQSAKLYYTGRKFPTTVALNRLYYFVPYLKGKGIRDIYLIKIARLGFRKEGTPEEDQNDLRLVFEIEFIGQLYNDYKSVDLKIWRTFTDTTLNGLLDDQDNEKHSFVV